MNRFLVLALGILILAGSITAWYIGRFSSPFKPSGTLVATVHYACAGGKTIYASYYEASSTPPKNPGEPPTPGGSVALVLSDERTVTLPQTISASGIRYANPSESFIFWSKGEGAFVDENNQETYSDCVEKK